jgi:hypothetical protein
MNVYLALPISTCITIIAQLNVHQQHLEMQIRTNVSMHAHSDIMAIYPPTYASPVQIFV